MFRKNEQVYGVQTTFEPSLVGYTSQLEGKDTKEFKDQEQKAAEIASEIESQPTHKVRADLENGDEEERFAAVARPTNEGKYVPPNKRNNLNTGKLTRSTPPPPSPSPASISKNVFNQLPPSSASSSNLNLTQASNISSVGPSPNHPSVLHQVSHSISMPPSGVVTQYNTPPFVPPPATTTTTTAMTIQPSLSVLSTISQQSQHSQSQVGFSSQQTQPPPANKLSLDKRERPGRQVYQSDKLPPAPFSQSNVITSHQQQQQHHQQQQQSSSSHASNVSLQQQTSLDNQRGELMIPKTEHRKIQQSRGRDEQHTELRQFATEFKLTETSNQEPPTISRKQHHSEHNTPQAMSQSHHPLPVHQQHHHLNQGQASQQQHQVSEESVVTNKPPTGPITVCANTAIQQVQRQTTSPMQQNVVDPTVDKITTTLKKSTLNPNAKEFNPNAKPFTPVS